MKPSIIIALLAVTAAMTVTVVNACPFPAIEGSNGWTHTPLPQQGDNSITSRNNYGRNDNNINVQAGDQFQIYLQSNPSTGYSWYPAQHNFMAGTSAMYNGCEYVSPKNGLMGAGGIEYWGFTATKPGTSSITLQYVRPWIKDRNDAATVTYNVTVN